MAPVAATEPAPAPATEVDPVLQDIFRKETAGHVAAVRDYIQRRSQDPAPHPVTEDLYRACHTLSGIAKTAGVRQGIKVAEPMEHYIRKLHDVGHGLPAEGLSLLKDTLRALENVVDHFDEDTGFFPDHRRLIVGWHGLERSLDGELARLSAPAESPSIPPGSVEFAVADAGAVARRSPVGRRSIRRRAPGGGRGVRRRYRRDLQRGGQRAARAGGRRARPLATRPRRRQLGDRAEAHPPHAEGRRPDGRAPRDGRSESRDGVRARIVRDRVRHRPTRRRSPRCRPRSMRCIRCAMRQAVARRWRRPPR